MSARGAKIFLVVVVSTLLAGNAIAGVVANDPRDTVAVQRPVSVPGVVSPAEYFIRNNTVAGCSTPRVRVGLGNTADQPLALDTDGDDLDQLAIYRSSTATFYVLASNTSGAAKTRTGFGDPGDIAITGNFDGADDDDEFGVYRPSTRTFYLRADNGSVLATIPMGAPGDIPLAGNFDGSADGSDEVGVFRPSTNTFYLRGAGNASVAFRAAMGGPGDLPLIGDWDRDGTDTIGVFRAGQIFLRNTNMPSSGADIRVANGTGGDTPVTGDFDGADTDENTGVCAP